MRFTLRQIAPIRRITVEMPQTLFDQLDAAARELDLTWSAVIRKAITRDLAFGLAQEIAQLRATRERVAAQYNSK